MKTSLLRSLTTLLLSVSAATALGQTPPTPHVIEFASATFSNCARVRGKP